jgi:hypothetical protein
MAASKYDCAPPVHQAMRRMATAPGTQVTGRPSTASRARGPGLRRLAKAPPSLRSPRKPRSCSPKRPVGLGAEPLAQLRVVAQLRVRIERQVVGEQVDVVRQQQGQALLHPAGDAPVLAAPEQAVVHEDGVGAGGDGRLDQRAAGGHAGDDAPDLGRPSTCRPLGP